MLTWDSVQFLGGCSSAVLCGEKRKRKKFFKVKYLFLFRWSLWGSHIVEMIHIFYLAWSHIRCLSWAKLLNKIKKVNPVPPVCHSLSYRNILLFPPPISPPWKQSLQLLLPGSGTHAKNITIVCILLISPEVFLFIFILFIYGDLKRQVGSKVRPLSRETHYQEVTVTA